MPPIALSAQLSNVFSRELSMQYPIPPPLEIHRIFNQLLIRRYNLSAQSLHPLTDEVPNLPEEHSIYFFEPFEGLMVVRSTADFERFLQSASQESLLELTVLFYHQLFLGAWKLDTRRLKPALFKRSVPAVWPDRGPDTGCVAFVKEHPVGIRLWAPVSEQEMEGWRTFRK